MSVRAKARRALPARQGVDQAAFRRMLESALGGATRKGAAELRRLARDVVAAAQRGELWALKEIGNALDGEPKEVGDAEEKPIEIRTQAAAKLVPLLVRPKRLKIAVGGRGASKSIGFGDAFLKFCADGEHLFCAREFQNSIDDSVHSLLQARIRALGVPGFRATATSIEHASGGSIIYKGLARNPESIRSLYGVKRVWIEEAQTLSEESLEILLPTIREHDSELWFSMNRGSSKDPIAQRLLLAHEGELQRVGYYEDDEILIVQINWRDNPWFPDVLEQERRRDFDTLPRAKYDHIWEGAYGDSVDNAIIEPEWFDACIDAHIKLGFQPLGAEIVAHDPADRGDAKALAHRHGSVIVECLERDFGDVNDGCDWATGYAANIKADEFVWDSDGMGVSLRRQIADAFSGKKVELTAFSGATTPDHPDAQYDAVDGDTTKSKTNRETFQNRRAQRYWELRDRVYRTFLAVSKSRKYLAPDELLSFSSRITNLQKLRAELCRIPLKDNATGRIQILTKPEMKAKGIGSPNLADAVMMTFEGGRAMAKPEPVSYTVPRAYNPWTGR